jgi:hypothetical protein
MMVQGCHWRRWRRSRWVFEASSFGRAAMEVVDGRDGKVDATDDNSAVNAPQCVPTTAASPEQQLLDDGAQLVHITNLYTTIATSTRDYVQKTSDDMHDLLIEMDDRANTRLEPFYNTLEGLLQ